MGRALVLMVVLGVAVGCAQQPASTDQPAKAGTVKAGDTAQPGTAGGVTASPDPELKVNPNSSIAQPGSKLGK